MLWTCMVLVAWQGQEARLDVGQEDDLWGSKFEELQAKMARERSEVGLPARSEGVCVCVHLCFPLCTHAAVQNVLRPIGLLHSCSR